MDTELELFAKTYYKIFENYDDFMQNDNIANVLNKKSNLTQKLSICYPFLNEKELKSIHLTLLYILVFNNFKK